MNILRIGTGYDTHRFAEGNFVMIGGVKIPHTQGVLAHSDGDVLLHAITDALLGAAALGDIGRHFPDTDPAFASMDSSAFVKEAIRLLQEKNYRVVNIDSTIITEAPRLSSHIDKMRDHISTLLGVSTDAVNVKATTNEKMGWIGRGEGLAAQVVVLISSDV